MGSITLGQRRRPLTTIIDVNQGTERQMMVLKSFVSHSAALASRPRILTTTFMCALSATVRFTSTADGGTKIPLEPAYTRNPVVSIMTGDDVPIFCRGWKPKPAQPIAFQIPGRCHAWPL
jgi:hypothetical protein